MTLGDTGLFPTDPECSAPHQQEATQRPCSLQSTWACITLTKFVTWPHLTTKGWEMCKINAIFIKIFASAIDLWVLRYLLVNVIFCFLFLHIMEVIEILVDYCDFLSNQSPRTSYKNHALSNLLL